MEKKSLMKSLCFLSFFLVYHNNVFYKDLRFFSLPQVMIYSYFSRSVFKVLSAAIDWLC